MVEELRGAGGAQPVGGPSEAQGVKQSADGGAAFKALLDRLQDQARDLQGASQADLDPSDLAGAVDRAHDSLRDALSLSDQLLEAYRETVQNTPEAEPGTED